MHVILASMLLLALSCLQGRPMQAAASELWSLGIDGLQLTPGNAPTPGFQDWLERSGIPWTTHHGFSFTALRQAVWDDAGRCLVGSGSVHPPKDDTPAAAVWREQWRGDGPAIETMYPGYDLGTGVAVEEAMDRGWPLAVDLAHLELQRQAGVLTQRAWNRILRYARIAEIHLSWPVAGRDAHQPIPADATGLAWARERLAEVPVIVEWYCHRDDDIVRQRQLALVRGG